MPLTLPFELEQLIVARPRRILLVDDDVEALELLELILQSYGQETCAVSDATKALSAAVAFSPHVAILDLDMPGLSGFQLADAIREQSPSSRIGIFALSGWADSVTVRRCKDFGFDRFFAKPMPIDQLCFAISEYD